MSHAGVKKAAALFSAMQELRIELISMGGKQPTTLDGKQDILLGHMLNDGHEAMKRRFMELTSSPKYSQHAADDERRRKELYGERFK